MQQSTKKLFQEIRRLRDHARVLILTTHATIEKTVEVMAQTKELMKDHKTQQRRSNLIEDLTLWLRAQSSARRHQTKR